MQDALSNTAATYRRDLLNFLEIDIEVWLEKDALSGVFYPVTAEFDIPLMVSRGFASLTFLHAAAASLQDGAFVYVFSDYDYAGEIIEAKIREGLREFSGGKTIHIERAMLTQQQIRDWDLPTRDPKANDRKNGYAQCAELDAVPPNQLRSAVRSCIEQHISADLLFQLRDIERAEKESIEEIFSYRTLAEAQQVQKKSNTGVFPSADDHCLAMVSKLTDGGLSELYHKIINEAEHRAGRRKHT